MALNQSPARNDAGSNKDRKKKGGRFSLLRLGKASAASASKTGGNATESDVEKQQSSPSVEKSMEPVSEPKDEPRGDWYSLRRQD